MPTPYSEIRPHLQTGDLLLYSGDGDFSAMIKTVTLCKWSHAAIVVRVPSPDMVLVWESCGNGVAFDNLDQQMSKTYGGFVRRVINYSAGDVAVRYLHHFRGEDFMPTFEAFRKEVEGRPYEQDRLELAKAILGSWGNSEEALASFFCSELVAETYKRWGLLPTSVPSNTYRPKDFSEAAGLLLCGDAYFGPEIPVLERAR